MPRTIQFRLHRSPFGLFTRTTASGRIAFTATARAGRSLRRTVRGMSASCGPLARPAADLHGACHRAGLKSRPALLGGLALRENGSQYLSDHFKQRPQVLGPQPSITQLRLRRLSASCSGSILGTLRSKPTSGAQGNRRPTHPTLIGLCDFESFQKTATFAPNAVIQPTRHYRPLLTQNGQLEPRSVAVCCSLPGADPLTRRHAKSGRPFPDGR